MTSVRNLLRLLSGSNILVLLAALLIIAGCSRKNSGSLPPDVTDTSVSKPAGRPPVDTVFPEIPDSILNSSLFSYKDTYNIAVLLPFYLDSFPTYDDMDLTPEQYDALKDRQLFKPSALAIEYYKGVKLALDSLAKAGLNVRTFVFDCYREDGIGSIIKSRVLDTMNLIIGPIYNSHIAELAPYCLKHQIPMVSPLSPSTTLSGNNPYFTMANPSLDIHVTDLFDFMTTNFEDDHLILLYQDNNNERHYVRMLQGLSASYKEQLLADSSNDFPPKKPDGQLVDTIPFLVEVPVPWDSYKNIADLDASSLNLALDPDKHNVILVPTVDMSLVQLLCQRLHALRDSFNVTVLGTPVWSKENELRLDYIRNLDIYYTTPVYFDTAYYQTSFYSSYLEDYGYEPPVYTVRAYDLTMFYGKLLRAYGLNFTELLPIEYYKGLHTNYNFKPVYASPDDSSTVKYYENKFVHILHFEPGGLKKVN